MLVIMRFDLATSRWSPVVILHYFLGSHGTATEHVPDSLL
jgi:hypothetical protein